MNEADYDTVRIFFADDTSTLIHVPEDDDIQDAIVILCDNERWSLEDVTGWKIEA